MRILLPQHPAPSPAPALSPPLVSCTTCQCPSSWSLSDFVGAVAACQGLWVTRWCAPSAWPSRPWRVSLPLSTLHLQKEPVQSRICHVYSGLAAAFPLPLLSLRVLSGKVPPGSHLSEEAFSTVVALSEHLPSLTLRVHRVCISPCLTVTAQRYS